MTHHLQHTLWEEDDANTRDADHEGIHQALRRLFGGKAADYLLKNEQEDQGDAFTRYAHLRITSSYPGASQIVLLNLPPYEAKRRELFYLLHRQLTYEAMKQEKATPHELPTWILLVERMLTLAKDTWHLTRGSGANHHLLKAAALLVGAVEEHGAYEDEDTRRALDTRYDVTINGKLHQLPGGTLTYEDISVLAYGKDVPGLTITWQQPSHGRLGHGELNRGSLGIATETGLLITAVRTDKA